MQLVLFLQAVAGTSEPMMEGWQGWDEYAPFYDWENARTLDRRDVRFWTRLVARVEGSVLELGCGTGRVSVPVARHARSFVGVDRSGPMLAQARRRFRHAGLPVSRAALVQGDIRRLSFGTGAFDLVIAPYGVVQSLLTDEDLAETFNAIARVLRPGGRFGIDLVPDVPQWREYTRRLRLSGQRPRSGARVRLIESVRQDRDRGLTIFDQEFVEGQRSRRRVQRFSLAFRTLPVPEMTSRLDRAGLGVDSVHGDYDGGPWDPRAEVWVLLAKRE